MLAQCAVLLEDHLVYLTKVLPVPDYSFAIKEREKRQCESCSYCYFKSPLSFERGRSRGAGVKPDKNRYSSDEC